MSEPGTTLIIPPGFAIISMNKSADLSVQGVRWQLPGGAQTAKYSRDTLDADELADGKMQIIYKQIEVLCGGTAASGSKL